MFAIHVLWYLVLGLLLQPNPKKYLLQKWELVGIQMGKKSTSEQEIRAKNKNTLIEFTEQGQFIIIQPHNMARKTINEWRLSEDNTKILISSLGEFDEKIISTLAIEQITPQKLVLSSGEEHDKETYTYRSLKK